jgi:hypothetical protein
MKKFYNTFLLLAVTLFATAQVPTNQLQGYFKFSGNGIDSTTPANNLTKVTEIAGNNDLAYTTDRNGNSQSALDNAASGLWRSNAVFNDNSGDTTLGTLGAWVYLNSNTTDAFVVSDFEVEDGTLYASMYLRIINNGLRVAVFNADGNTDYIESQANTIPVNQWTHLTGVYDRQNNRLSAYINGVMVSYLDNCLKAGVNHPVYVGGYYKKDNGVVTCGLPLDGAIDDVTVYSRALLSCEVATLAGVTNDSINLQIVQLPQTPLFISQSRGTMPQWINCADNTAIPGATDYIFSASATGSYALVLDNGCRKDTTECLSITIETGIDELYTSQLTLYPNPANSSFTVTGAVVTQIHLYDLTGRQVAATTGNTIQVSNLQPGLYQALITGNNGLTATKRVVVQ